MAELYEINLDNYIPSFPKASGKLLWIFFISLCVLFFWLRQEKKKKKMTIERSCLLAKGSNRRLCHLQECIEVFFYRNEKPFRSTLNPPVLLYKRHLWDSYRVVNIRSILYTKTFLVKERKIHFARPFHWLLFSLWMSKASTPPKCSAICTLWHDILCWMTFARANSNTVCIGLYSYCDLGFFSVLFFRTNVCNQRYMDLWGSKTYLDT